MGGGEINFPRDHSRLLCWLTCYRLTHGVGVVIPVRLDRVKGKEGVLTVFT